jgi:FKBP-type peptidyl-prolyl cis-trans isomerase FkpA
MRLLSTISMFAAVIAVTSCGKLNYKTSPSGFPYKIFSDGKGQQVKLTDVVKFHIENKVNDSIYRTTFGATPAYVQTTTFNERYDITEIWEKMRVGDSVIVIQSMDTFLKRNSSLPAEIKKGDRLIITLKILGVFENDSLAKVDQKKDSDKLAATEKEDIKKYLSANKIEGVQETPSGAFVKINNPGTGNLINSGNYVSVKYKGMSWSGKIFDTNMDSSFGRAALLDFSVDVTPMIKGFSEAVKLLGKGGEATIYIPSALGYGSEGNPPMVAPNEKLIFEIKIVEVKDKAPDPEPVKTRAAIDSTKKKQ